MEARRLDERIRAVLLYIEYGKKIGEIADVMELKIASSLFHKLPDAKTIPANVTAANTMKAYSRKGTYTHILFCKRTEK
jgi:hypothetical protein